MKDFSKNFSEALKAARGSRSQAEMARIYGLKQPTYLRYEAGKNEPGITVAYRIARKLGITVDELLAGGNNEGETSHSLRLAESSASCGASSTFTPHHAGPYPMGGHEGGQQENGFLRVQDAVKFLADQLGVTGKELIEAIMPVLRSPDVLGNQGRGASAGGKEKKP